MKQAGSFLVSRGFCTSILIPESSNAALPSELLSTKPVVSEERKIGSNIFPHFALHPS